MPTDVQMTPKTLRAAFEKEVAKLYKENVDAVTLNARRAALHRAVYLEKLVKKIFNEV